MTKKRANRSRARRGNRAGSVAWTSVHPFSLPPGLEINLTTKDMELPIDRTFRPTGVKLEFTCKDTPGYMQAFLYAPGKIVAATSPTFFAGRTTVTRNVRWPASTDTYPPPSTEATVCTISNIGIGKTYAGGHVIGMLSFHATIGTDIDPPGNNVLEPSLPSTSGESSK